MTFSEEELRAYRATMDNYLNACRPPESIRNEFDLGYSIEDQSVEIYVIRPDWQDSSKKLHSPVAKATWLNDDKAWEISVMRSDLKWHKYEQVPTVKELKSFLEEVENDPNEAFWG